MPTLRSTMTFSRSFHIFASQCRCNRVQLCTGAISLPFFFLLQSQRARVLRAPTKECRRFRPLQPRFYAKFMSSCDFPPHYWTTKTKNCESICLFLSWVANGDDRPSTTTYYCQFAYFVLFAFTVVDNTFVTFSIFYTKWSIFCRLDFCYLRTDLNEIFIIREA